MPYISYSCPRPGQVRSTYFHHDYFDDKLAAPTTPSAIAVGRSGRSLDRRAGWYRRGRSRKRETNETDALYNCVVKVNKHYYGQHALDDLRRPQPALRAGQLL
jgi:hypothetical protein